MRKKGIHTFALFYAPMPHLKKEDSYIITDKELVTRIGSILRLRVGEHVTLFNQIYHTELEIVAIHSKTIVSTVTAFHKNTLHTPRITILLPLLKKDDLSTAVGDLTAVGVSEIQLIITDTVQRTWGDEHEYARLERVMIAAAEQSKNFTLPLLHAPINFDQALQQYIKSDVPCVYGEPTGNTFKQTIQGLPATPTQIIVLVGPEADFTHAEKELLNRHNAIACRLTPTVLRAHLAITVLVAGIRSWYNAAL